VELLVVIAIIAMLVGLLVPAVASGREAARRNLCSNHLRQVGLSLLNHHATQDRFPSGSTLIPRNGVPGLSWHVFVLPYIEQQALYDQINPQPNGMATNSNAGFLPIATFVCPSAATDASQNPSHYVGIAGAGRNGAFVDLEDTFCGDYFNDGLLYPASQTTEAHVKDGLSNTMMVGERNYYPEAWMDGAYWQQSPKRQICMNSTKNVRWPINCSNKVCGFSRRDPNAPDDAKQLLENDTMYSSAHSAGAQFVYADGHVKLESSELDLECYKHLATIQGGEVLCK